MGLRGDGLAKLGFVECLNTLICFPTLCGGWRGAEVWGFLGVVV